MPISKEKLLKRAVRLFKGQHSDEALMLCSDLVEEAEKVDDFKFLATVSDLLQAEGRVSLALDAQHRIAGLHRRNRRYQEAVAAYDLIIKIRPSDGTAHERLADTHRQMGNKSGASVGYRRAADAYVSSGKISSAIGMLKACLAINAGDTHARLRLADLYAQVGRSKDAVEQLRLCICEPPKEALLNQLLTATSRIVDKFPQNTAVARQLAKLHAERGQVQHAALLLNQSLERNPEAQGILQQLAETLAEAGDAALSLATYKRLARTLERKGRKEEAERIWVSVLVLAPDDEDANHAASTNAAPAAELAPLLPGNSAPPETPNTASLPSLDTYQSILRAIAEEIALPAPSQRAAKPVPKERRSEDSDLRLRAPKASAERGRSAPTTAGSSPLSVRYWVLRRAEDGQLRNFFTLEQLKQWLLEGSATPEDEVSHQGGPWEIVAGLRELQAFLSSLTTLRAAKQQSTSAKANPPMQTTFISYGTPDENFARKMFDALTKNGVSTFFFPVSATPGDQLHQMMRKGVNEHERVLLICSRSSLERKGVRNEINETFAREAREGGVALLLPITIDDYLLSSEWRNSDSAETIERVLDRVVADFRGTESDDAKFDLALQKLLSALRVRSKKEASGSTK